MSRLLFTSDLHLGHNNICKYRTQFSSPEEHNEIIFDNLATNVEKRDTLYLLGDIAFSLSWLERISSINCKHKLLVCGNHDLEHGITMRHLVAYYDDVKTLFSKRNNWISHCPIHEQELRGRVLNIHGHLHGSTVKGSEGEEDPRYFNVCVEHTGYKPISYTEIKERGVYE